MRPEQSTDSVPDSDSSRVAVRDQNDLVDDINKRLIEELQIDGRRSYAALARRVGLSEAAVRQRVQRLIDQDVIKITAVTNAASVGFRRQALVGIKVEGDITQVASKLTGIPEADYVVISAGSYDILIELVCEDDEHLLRTIDGAIRSVPGVRSTETFVYLKLAKETYTWGTR
jgi:Lrp/AsnC family transcriptional regulator for asnA, asnC and gidA